MGKIELPGYLKVLSITVLIIIIVFILITGRAILIPVFLAGYIAMLMTPVCNWMEARKIPRTISAVLSLLAAIAIIVGIIHTVIVQVKGFTADLEGVDQRLNFYLDRINVFLTSNLGIETGFGGGIERDQIGQFLQSNSAALSDFVLNAIGSLAGVILVPVFIFFFLIYRDHLSVFVAKFFDRRKEGAVQEELHSIRKVVQYYILGMFKVMAILAVLNTAALYALGVKHALFFGLFAALLNIIPYLGPFLGAILPFTFSFLTTDSLFTPLAVVALFTFIQMIESNFLTPKIVGSNVQLNALITFVGLLVGGAIWGVVGMILIIPIMAILKRTFELIPSAEPFAHLFGEEKKLIKTPIEK
ncbi:AI-2E family transporter [Anditalea andensis]|uniref:Transporter n=1 Tax=Anditalea andensis TaxID=1048983 RepID=A0A074LJ81_9BACT|nr:AI-2E family transporter [Anditalea andensis]KEO73877.1 transporter [Anditalea andensis]